MNLCNRIVGALALRPMTIKQLATCLSVTPEGARFAVESQVRRGFVRRRGFARSRSRYLSKIRGSVVRASHSQLFELTNAGLHYRAQEIRR